MAALPPWGLTQLQAGAILDLAARHALEAMATPGETSPAPPWSKPLFSSNQPWAQKRNAATTANPTQSGQWVRLMQIIRLPQLDGAGPPEANPWRESRQFCISPVLPPCFRWQRRFGPGAAGTSSTSPLATAWFLPSERSGGPLGKPGRAENGSLPSFPRRLSPGKRGVGTAGATRCLPGIVPVARRGLGRAPFADGGHGLHHGGASPSRSFPGRRLRHLGCQRSASLGATGPSLCRNALACGSSRACPCSAKLSAITITVADAAVAGAARTGVMDPPGSTAPSRILGKPVE